MHDTVGSLTQRERSIVIGSILGDGYLRKLKGRKNAFLEINHSIKAKDYVHWKYENLKRLCKSEPKERVSSYLGGKEKRALRFYTIQHPELTEIMDGFYRQGKKVIPKNLKLNPLILAVWFMDDGSRSRGNFYLNTQQFSFKDQRYLLYLLRELGLRARLNKDKQYYRIRFLKESVPKLKELIGPYVIDSLKYKIE